MKFSSNDFHVPHERCSCRVIGQDPYMRVVMEQCFRCSVMEIQRRRHQRIEWALLGALVVVHIGSIVFSVGFDGGWW